MDNFLIFFQLNFWKDPSRVGVASDIMVPPEVQQSLENLLSSNNVDFFVTIHDVRKYEIHNQKTKKKKLFQFIIFPPFHFIGPFISFTVFMHQFLCFDFHAINIKTNFILFSSYYYDIFRLVSNFVKIINHLKMCDTFISAWNYFDDKNLITSCVNQIKFFFIKLQCPYCVSLVTSINIHI